MTAAERRRLVGVLGRLDSDFDGERAAAGLLASRMLRSAGLDWDALLPADKPPRPPVLHATGWRGDLAFCERHRSFLREWESGFVASVGSRSGLTPKQRTVLAEIAVGLRARGEI